MNLLQKLVRPVDLPQEFLEWQCEERRSLFDTLVQGRCPRFMASHLPVLSSLNEPGAPFPIRSSTKGVGLLPRPEFLLEHVQEIHATLVRCREISSHESLNERIGTARSLYERPERIDPGTLGSIEIFRGQTYHNLCRDPRATLLFTGSAPRYLSFQVNCTVEILGLEDLRFQFIRGMRFLFEPEQFHIRQPDYPLGYLFRVQEVFEKTPRMGRAGKNVGQYGKREEYDREDWRARTDPTV